MRIPPRLYRRILGSIPLLCVDGIIRDSSDRFLLVKRRNDPLKNRWWVPGGRVLKGETLEHAFRRKMREELGIKLKELRCVGFYEVVGIRHPGIKAYGGRLHTLSIVFESRSDTKDVVLDSQSSDWGYFDQLPARFKVQSFAVE